MRPTKLIISAFGSYADKTVIDLDKLGEKGLYLITGDTGAGKTTVFDAVTFALFGEPSGGNRDTSMFRSKYADSETPTEVELTFLYRGGEYYIKRNPDYERPKKRGEGITKTAADAELRYPDGRIVTKVRDVNRAVTEILGVEREQFAQIAMIAQGEFLKLLLADTKTRKEIFRKLFHTENYEKLQNKLSDAFKSQKDLLEKAKEGLNFSIGSIICDSEVDSALAQNVSAAKSGQLTVTAAESEVIPRLEALIASDKAEAKENTAKKSDMENKLKELTSLLEKAQKYQTYKKALSDINDKLEASRNKLSDLAAACERSRSDKEKAGAQLTEQKPKLEKLLDVLRELETEKSALDSTDIAIAECKANIEGSREKSQKYEDEIKACKTELEKLQNAEVEREKIVSRKTESDTQLKGVKKLQGEYSVYANLLSDLEKAQSDYLDRSAKAEAAKNEFDQMQKAYLDEQAGILAEELAEGAPCPVCGSTTHPILAKKSENAPDKAALDKYKERSEELGKKAAEASERSGSLKALAEEKESSIRKNAAELLGVEISIEDVPAKTEEKAKELSENSERLQSELIEAENNIKRKSELNGKAETLDKDMEKLKISLGELEKQLASLTSAGTEKTARIKELNEKLNGDTRTAAEINLEIAAISNNSELAEKAYEQADKNVKDCNVEIAGFEGQLGEIRKNIEENPIPDSFDFENSKAEQGELDKQKALIDVKLTDISHRLKTNETALENIRARLEEYAKTERRWQIIKPLNDTANGTVGGMEKIKLETFAQMAYFDRIINRANVRLMVMSEGQYELKRTGAVNKQSQSGLDLAVTDHYNGSERSVKTLSGGESFIASLSLALGLADEVQSSAGGIQLDTMFVDEGFGSLDEEALKFALKALSDLAANGNRLIGIISHVGTLKEKIDRQIIVRKQSFGGSTAEIRTE